ncbi:terminase small subunit [Photorhabdus heterorhabditis]|uniref:terminase small subunit n=1 Tax=Photorhabdus heterorhabditis TaxID=880156 RepID=UPI001BD48335|nr:terminase small subunit [Photorhabdus heterorhabditis]MBS9443014.1 hypothetical protein [Photorhabdus heterorhabditis]
MAKNTDWEGIERDYRSGFLSIREIAKQHGISDAAIRKRTKTEGWVRTIVESTQCGPDANQAESQVASSTSNILESEKFAESSQGTAGILKPQYEQFAQNIAAGMPMKEAAICAGYSPARADSQSSILIRRPEIKARIRELRNEAALLVSFNAGHLAELSFRAGKEALADKKFGQVAPNIKNAAQLTGIDMSSNKTEVNVDLAGLSYGKVCIVTPANCPADVWASHMEKLREGKQVAQSS